MKLPRAKFNFRRRMKEPRNLEMTIIRFEKKPLKILRYKKLYLPKLEKIIITRSGTKKMVEPIIL